MASGVTEGATEAPPFFCFLKTFFRDRSPRESKIEASYYLNPAVDPPKFLLAMLPIILNFQIGQFMINGNNAARGGEKAKIMKPKLLVLAKH